MMASAYIHIEFFCIAPYVCEILLKILLDADE